MGEFFLRELWERKAKAEQPKAVSELEKMRRLVEGNEKLEKLFLEVIKASLRYCRTRDTLGLLRIEAGDVKALEECDRARRIAHNVLIDSINILSRACLSEGVSNKWREKFGRDRDVIGDWAVGLANDYKKEKMIEGAKEEI